MPSSSFQHDDVAPQEVRATPMTCIDLFCGCGGFSLGMIRAGFRVLAAVDFNKEAVATAMLNLGEPKRGGEVRHIDRPIPHVIECDLTAFTPKEMEDLIGCHHVDVIVGGPPCQGFSSARQRDGANHGARRFIEDPRRHLYREFLKYVGHFRPKVFVMENVLGIRSAAGGEYYTRVMHEARKLGYRVQSQIEDAWRLGVPQKRRRQLFIGTRQDIPGYFASTIEPAPRARAFPPLRVALAGLPRLQAGEGSHHQAYPRKLLDKPHQNPDVAHYQRETLEVGKAGVLSGHVARPHNATDLKCFGSLKEGENSATAMRRNPRLWFPYNRQNFKDRYTRQSRSGPCSTIVAHLSKDGLMFIHPTQNRSLTPREAARIQSFPDWFNFPESRTHAFRLIGNAVPPLVAEAVGSALRKFIEKETTNMDASSGVLIPKSELEAARELERIVGMSAKEIRALDREELCRAWNSVFFLYPSLHPDECDPKDSTEHALPEYWLVSKVDPRIFTPHSVRSGWPTSLAPLHAEALRRVRRMELTDEEFYPTAAQSAGIQWRETNLTPDAVV